jgi:small subunit ribosomal protein S9
LAATQFYATGRRKEATARVFLRPGSGAITINRRAFDNYFPIEALRVQVQVPLVLTEVTGQFDVLATVSGGGIAGQAGALRLGIARGSRRTAC